MTLLEPSQTKIITLITDFGYRDPFVGQMKGVILSINPSVKIVDITHNIERHDIEEAAYLLYSSYKYFPSGTIHVAVVDPEVGSKRKALVFQIEDHYFLSPDNGIISYLLRDNNYRAFEIENVKYLMKEKSSTFQGRDLFAPAAAWLSKGIRIEDFGKAVREVKKISIPEPILVKDKGAFKILGQVVHIDQFGNLITNIRIDKEKPVEVIVKGLSLPFVNFYSEAANKPAALINSDDLVEIFLYKGNASETLNIKKGTPVEVYIHG